MKFTDGFWQTRAGFTPLFAQEAYDIRSHGTSLEVIAPTIAAACALEPAHQTWVLDDGDRPWVAELCEELGARYVRRPEHTHAKAGNMNHALELMAREIDEGADLKLVRYDVQQRLSPGPIEHCGRRANRRP